jgi:hypothetical protein
LRTAAASAFALLAVPACGQVPVASPEPETPSESPASAQHASPTAPTPATPIPSDFAQTLEVVESGVVMVRATTCSGTGIGSGFLVGPGQIVTAAHVVDGAVSVAIAEDDTVHRATVTGLDTEHDLALLSTGELSGHVFAMSPDVPGAGTAVAVVGHPLGEPLTITEGNVSRVDEDLWPNLQLDVSVSPGNSGGPVVTADGSVVGVMVSKDVEADGLAYALRGDAAAPFVGDEQPLDPPLQPACSAPLGPGDADVPIAPASDALEQAVAHAFARYFGGINGGDYRTAYRQLSPDLRTGYESWARGVSTSYDFDFDVRSLTPTPSGAAVWLRFVSLQEPDFGPVPGEGCTQWSLDYELIWSSPNRLLIDDVDGHNGSDGHRACS